MSLATILLFHSCGIVIGELVLALPEESSRILY